MSCGSVTSECKYAINSVLVLTFITLDWYLWGGAESNISKAITFHICEYRWLEMIYNLVGLITS